MSETVKPKRKYNSGRRTLQAAETRHLVIEAARTLFVTSGWQATTIAGIAKAAAVSTETIYATFKNKETILQAVVEVAVRGQEPDKPLLEQRGPVAIANADNQSAQIALFAEDICRVLVRVADVMAVLRTAGETEPSLFKLYVALHEGRRKNLSFVAAALIRNGSLRDDIDSATATAHIWRLASPELFLLMTKVEGVSHAAYAEWLSDALKRVLLQV
jgi:AcrR family transcriptional regulator